MGAGRRRNRNFGGRARRLGLGVVLSGAAILAIGGATASSVGADVQPLASTCADDHVCFWHNDNYSGDKVSRGIDFCEVDTICRVTNDNDFAYHSLKNRLNVVVLTYDRDHDPAHCIGPGGNRDSLEPGVFYYQVGGIDHC